MDKIRRIPHEANQPQDAEDGLNVTGTETDTEGHGAPGGDGALNRGPGTGGDFSPPRMPTGGELIDENDVEGHSIDGEGLINRGPGTGGDFSPPRMPTGGELIDDTDLNGR
jgi:hypothetical protein